MGNAKLALQVAGTVALLGPAVALFGPAQLQVGSFPIACLTVIMACGIFCSLFLAIFFQFEPPVPSDSRDSWEGMALVVFLPTSTVILLHTLATIIILPVTIYMCDVDLDYYRDHWCACFLPLEFWSVFPIFAWFVLPGLVAIGVTYAHWGRPVRSS